MKRRCAILLVASLLMVPAIPGGADEKKDHVCFRALDADQDGMVTFEEFEKYYGDDEAQFKAADTDQNGKLTHGEYHRLLGHGSS